MEIVRVNDSNLDMLENFISNLGDAAKSFRYFNHRNINMIKNHLLTLLILKDGRPVAYGHLDSENGIVWLGVCVLSHFQGQGLSNMIMSELIDFAKKNEVKKIHLTVDNDNANAIYLYEKFGFKRKENEIYSEYILDCKL